MGFASLFYAQAMSFLMLAPLFIWFAPDMTRRELTDFVGGEGRLDEYTFNA
jgi:hypothetical protein